MRNVMILVVVVCSIVFRPCPSQAQQLLESYQSFLSERDHFNSSGERLTTAAAIIRQDRANFHRFGLRDQGDESDRFFADGDNRAALERMLERGRAEPGVISRIVNGTPFVRVEVWRGNFGPFVVVTLVEPPSGEPQATECVVADPTGTPLNVRTVPNGQIVGTLENGMIVNVIEHSTDRNQKPWAYVADQKGRPLGWIFRQFIECSVRVTKASPPSGSSPEQTPDAKEEKTGTGFFVSDDGYLITNEHVVNSCNKLTIIGAAEEKNLVRLVRVSKLDDLALLKADIKPRATTVFQESARINQGSTVVAYGYPLTGLLASTGNVSTGLVTALAGLDDNPRQMQISAPVQPGNSGGPLVDTKGALVGVVVSKLNAIAVARITKDIPQNINFAIKSSSVIDLLDANSVKYHSESLQRELPVEVLTQKMKEYTVRIECK